MQRAILTFALAGALAFAQKPVLTTNGGVPVGDNQNSKTAGDNGPVLLEDIHLIEKLASFDRERIPERVVHARGAGAYGEFVSAGDFSAFTRASFLRSAGRKTPVFVRFSTVIHGSGSPEVARDPRGFATKFYTEEGNYDIVGNHLPVFFIRDAIKFPDMVHSLKPSPVTNKQDPNRFFDFFSHVPESTQMLTFVYSDHGIPANYRQMDGFGVHAFKWVSAAGEVRYVKYTWKSQQGVKNLTNAEAAQVVAKDWAQATTDLYTEIGKGNYPKWDLYVQMIAPDQLDSFSFNPLDATKIWPESMAKPVKIGTMTLNRMPQSFYEETEQSAFSPGNLVPGIEASEDRLLQGRLFSYFDTQRHRLGANFQQLAINRPASASGNHNQDGALSQRGQKGDVNYQPSEADARTYRDDNQFRYSRAKLSGTTVQQPIAKQNNFQQAGELYRSFTPAERERLVANLAGDLAQVKNPRIVKTMAGFFFQADAEFGSKLAKALGIDPVKAD
ncbi:MAG: catalase [Acidobacteria bacterium]|nr:catalase [Acidobacteriota bacterium]